MILIFSKKITPRIEYVFEHIAREYLGLKPVFISDILVFQQSYQPMINYSSQFVNNCINLPPDPLLFEENVNKNIQYKKLNDIGKCFYWLSRYEEYIANEDEFDEHNRFFGINHDYSSPVVDLICLNIKDQIAQLYPNLKLLKRSFQQINTHDVDYAWKYTNKGLVKTFCQVAKNIFKGNFHELLSQIKVVLHKEKDPYDEYQYLEQQAKANRIKTIFFWQLGNNGKIDKNLSWKNKKQRKLIKKILNWADIGIHPSYQSNYDLKLLKKELKRLNIILNKQVSISRQHYIKLHLPTTYQQLLKNNIHGDYSMGFASKIGFRAGTCTPFKWYDLTTNQQTVLTIFPFVAMDTTLKNYLHLSPEQAITELKKLKEEVRAVNGLFVTLFHPSNLNGEWKNWRNVYESILE